MKDIEQLLQNNKAWSEKVCTKHPDFFPKLAKQQSPQFLWIGCSDSRVPANQITGLLPGEIFVHRNIANLVINTDINLLSVLQFAIQVLKVRHIIVCGHYGCGGINNALQRSTTGIIDFWLNNIRDTYRKHAPLFTPEMSEIERLNLLTELNVKQQVENLANCSIITDAWKQGQALHLHGWIYSIQDGIVQDLGITQQGEPST
jgi:carbonic anhydrase